MNGTTQLVEALECDRRICAAFLLGSAVSDRMRPESDVDIAILPISGQKLNDMDKLALAAELSLQSGKPVDIGILSSQNLVYAKEAILTGKEIFTKDRKYTDLMTTTFLGMYIMFQEERREVLDAYRS